MPEPVDGGEKSGVVYLGRSSFKMKAGVTETPSAGTAAAPRASAAAAAVEDRAAARHADAAAVIEDGAAARHAASPDGVLRARRAWPRVTPLVSGVALAKTTLIGLCLITFSGGIVTTVAIDRVLAARASGMRRRRAGDAAALVPPAPGFEAYA